MLWNFLHKLFFVNKCFFPYSHIHSVCHVIGYVKGHLLFLTDPTHVLECSHDSFICQQPPVEFQSPMYVSCSTLSSFYFHTHSFSGFPPVHSSSYCVAVFCVFTLETLILWFHTWILYVDLVITGMILQLSVTLHLDIVHWDFVVSH